MYFVVCKCCHTVSIHRQDPVACSQENCFLFYDRCSPLSGGASLATSFLYPLWVKTQQYPHPIQHVGVLLPSWFHLQRMQTDQDRTKNKRLSSTHLDWPEGEVLVLVTTRWSLDDWDLRGAVKASDELAAILEAGKRFSFYTCSLLSTCFVSHLPWVVLSLYINLRNIITIFEHLVSVNYYLSK